MRYLFLTCLLWLAIFPAFAESRYTTSKNQAITVSSRLDFEVSIPRLLYLRVGAGSAFANNSTISLIDFTVPANQMGSGLPLTASAGSGDLGNGVVTAMVMANDGDVSLSSTTSGSLSSGTGSSIPYSEILTTASALSSPLVLPAPDLVSASTTTISISADSGQLVNRNARWTYNYKNSQVVPAGIYGGSNINNGRVVYTVSMP